MPLLAAFGFGLILFAFIFRAALGLYALANMGMGVEGQVELGNLVITTSIFIGATLVAMSAFMEVL